MMMKELVLKNRSYRRFQQNSTVSMETLKELVELARLSATGGNVQPLKFMLSGDAPKNAKIFSTLGWAAYLKDWGGPVEGERPAAYIVILGDKRLKPSFGCDHGIAAQSMLLGATEKGLGGCIVATIQKPALSQALSIPEHFEILLVIALGKPKETVVIEALGPAGDIKYWRDAAGVHHVPKRSLDELIVG
jgi:nitroreductase